MSIYTVYYPEKKHPYSFLSFDTPLIEDSDYSDHEIWSKKNKDYILYQQKFEYIQPIRPPYICFAKQVKCPDLVTSISLENGHVILCSSDQKIWAAPKNRRSSCDHDYSFMEASSLTEKHVVKQIGYGYCYEDMVANSHIKLKEVSTYDNSLNDPYYEFESNYGYVDICAVSFEAKPTTLGEVGFYITRNDVREYHTFEKADTFY